MADERTIRGELESYLKERDLNEYFTSIIESCLLVQPQNPSMHITRHLFSKFPGQFPLQVNGLLYISFALRTWLPTPSLSLSRSVKRSMQLTRPRPQCT